MDNKPVQEKKVVMALCICLLMFWGCIEASSAQFNPRQKLMARRAAKIDALRNLTETIFGFRMDSGTVVRDFVTASDVMKTRFSAAIQGAREVDYQEADDGTAEVTVEIEIRVIEDIVGRKLVYDTSVVEAIGYGVPPGIPVMDQTTGAGSGLRSTGYGLPPNVPNMLPAEMDITGFRAAKIDALRNLAEKIYQIQITSDSLVRDFAIQNDTIRARLDRFIGGASVVSEKKMPDDRYEVEVELNINGLEDVLGIQK